jgi:nucleoside-diphosphate-sugar epimerase|tara:strand:+ start:236 stop:1258 length:1023 start_codon:yes stop_codon:yes gene_type:complete
MKFLITGVSGFVGEELVNFLQKDPNHSILGIDRSKELYSEQIIFKKCDLISETNKLDSIFDEFKPDAVIHCASKILDTYDKNLVWKTNYYASKDLIEISARHKVKKFIFISTFSIFQKNYDQPIDENEKPSYKTTYGETKYLTEQMLLKSNFSGDICILRCPIMMGKKRSYRFGILFGLIKDNYNIPLIGKANNKLSFVHVTDVCRAIECFLQCSGKHIFNVAADEHEEFQFILRRLIKKVNSKSKLIHFNKIIGNLMFEVATFLRLVPYTSYHKKIFNYSIILDTSKIKKTLNWRPIYSIEKMFEENYLHSFQNANFNPDSFSKKKAKEGLIKILKKII